QAMMEDRSTCETSRETRIVAEAAPRGRRTRQRKARNILERLARPMRQLPFQQRLTRLRRPARHDGCRVVPAFGGRTPRHFIRLRRDSVASEGRRLRRRAKDSVASAKKA